MSLSQKHKEVLVRMTWWRSHSVYERQIQGKWDLATSPFQNLFRTISELQKSFIHQDEAQTAVIGPRSWCRPVFALSSQALRFELLLRHPVCSDPWDLSPSFQITRVMWVHLCVFYGTFCWGAGYQLHLSCQGCSFIICLNLMARENGFLIRRAVDGLLAAHGESP